MASGVPVEAAGNGLLAPELAAGITSGAESLQRPMQGNADMIATGKYELTPSNKGVGSIYLIARK